MLPLLYFIHIGSPLIYIVGVLLMIQAVREYKAAIKTKVGSKLIGDNVIYVLSISMLLNISSIKYKYVLMLSVILLAFILGFKNNEDKNIYKDKALFWIGAIYIVLGVEAIIRIRLTYPKGELFAYMIFVITVVSDSMAYFVGKRFGKRKLAPTVSPNKTIEGSIGAIFFTIIACILYNLFFIKVNPVYIILIGFFGSIISQLGDLIASKVKRVVGVKDFGNLIPEHGGVLDRLDSAILVSQFMLIGLSFLKL